MTARTIVGIDPGGTFTGFVTRRGDECRYHLVVTRGSPYMATYIAEVLSAARKVVERAGGVIVAQVAVEDLNAPTPHLGITSVKGLLGAAQVLGAVLGEWTDAVVVPPAGHGSGPLLAYPAELVGARERTGTGVLRHARSAWDIAGAAARQLRLQELAR